MRLATTADEVRAAGGVAIAAPTDVSDPGAVEALREHVLESVGPPLIAINAAGVFGPIEFVKDGDPGEWIATLMVDAVAPYLVARAFVGGMIEAGWGASSTSRRPRHSTHRVPSTVPMAPPRRRSTSSPATSPPSWRAPASRPT